MSGFALAGLLVAAVAGYVILSVLFIALLARSRPVRLALLLDSAGPDWYGALALLWPAILFLSLLGWLVYLWGTLVRRAAGG